MNTAPTGAQYETGAFSDSDDADDANGNLTIDFGFQIQNPLQVGVGNLVFIDQNANGMADDNEGVPGVLLQVFPSTANPLSDTPPASTPRPPSRPTLSESRSTTADPTACISASSPLLRGTVRR